MGDLIRHKRSSTPGAVPTAGQLELGELVINTADGRVYLKKSNGSVILLGGDKEDAIAAGTTAQYWRGDKTWQDLPAAVRAALLTGLSTASSADVAATDTVLAAIGKLQAGKVPRDSATGAARLPAGTTAQRPAGALGDFRRNTTTGKWEGHDGSAWADVGGINLAAAQATTSGASIDFTGVPSWANRITVSLSGVSTNGSSNIQVQLGTSSGVEAAGYNSAASYTSGGANNSASSTSGMAASASINSSYSLSGALTLTRISANAWVSAGVTSSGAQVMPSSGSKTLSGTLDRIRLTTVNGTDTFDAGSVNIMWE